MIAPPDHIPDYRRLHVFYAIMASLLAVIVVRLWYLQIVKGPELAAESEMRRTRTVRRLAARGSIEDTHGHVLARAGSALWSPSCRSRSRGARRFCRVWPGSCTARRRTWPKRSMETR